MADTIVALSSGALPAGIAVLRLSGPLAHGLVAALCGPLPGPRQLSLRPVRIDGETVDTALIAIFPAPTSFTGEDCAELHLHGSPAVVRRLLRHFGMQPGVRLAEAGEFTRRAFYNGRLDLTAAEGLADLIAAETESQRRLAVLRADGALERQVDAWRERLLDQLALVEAHLDFSDEGDVGDDGPQVDLADLIAEFEHQAESGAGRLVREGFRVALAGAPNAGKSSLINALTNSDLAIVSAEPGTTRDIREVSLDLGGRLVVLLDTAGLRESDSLAEQEGVRRARAALATADLVLVLVEPGGGEPAEIIEHVGADCPVWRVASKSDLGQGSGGGLAVSALSGAGIETLLAAISDEIDRRIEGAESLLVSHERDRAALLHAAASLRRAETPGLAPELVAEQIRQAVLALERLVGRIDAEEILGRIFSRFCIGK